MKKEILPIFFVLAYSIANGQNYKLKDPIPADTSWKIGFLNNGIHYFIKSNKVTENRANFYILYNVGSLQETEKQNGLAHFTEHLAFASNKNCPKSDLENYFKNLGLKSTDMNAATSLGSTRYELCKVPLTKKGVLDTIMLYINLHATCMALDSEKIELERKVILEEWRRGDNASKRTSQKIKSIIYQGSKYANTSIIGDTNILKHFRHPELKDYYNKWYRPDHMSVIAVGDFDVKEIELQLKKTLEKIPSATGPSPRESYPIPDNKNPIIAIVGDREAQSTDVGIYYKHDPETQYNLNWMKNQIIDELIVRMRQKRILERTLSKSSIITGYSSTFLGVPEKTSYYICGGASNGKAIGCLKDMLLENERAFRFGFTITEVEKAKASFLRIEDFKIRNLEKKPNMEYFNDCSDHIMNGTPLINYYFKNDFLKKIVPLITQEEINKRFKYYLTHKNMVISISGPQTNNLKIPTEAEVQEAIKVVKTLPMPPYVDLSDDRKLFNLPVVPGNIIENKTDSIFGTTEWKLSNGIHVILKHTDFNNNEIHLLAVSHGGLATVKDTDILTGKYLSKMTDMMGVYDMSKIDLGEYLSGNALYAGLTLYESFDGIGGKCSPKEFETLMQLIHLYFARPRFDESAFDKFVSDEKNNYFNRTTDPNAVFSDTVQYVRGNKSYRSRPTNPAEFSFRAFLRLYKEHFSDPGNFTFIIAGNINLSEAKPFIE